MKSTRWFITITLMLGPALLPSSLSVAHSAQAATVQSASTDESQRPLYTPPKNYIPRARVGGEIRGTDGPAADVAAIAPDHVALTISKSPTLNWYLSKPTTHKVMFVLNDTTKVHPIYESQIPTPKEAGIHSIRLKDLGISLDTNVQYRWFVSVVRDPDSPSSEIVAGSIIERCELTDCIQDRPIKLACEDKQSVVDNAQSGLWYDAMACLCNLIDRNPASIELRKIRIQLLRDIGLPAVAEWDMRAIQSLLR